MFITNEYFCSKKKNLKRKNWYHKSVFSLLGSETETLIFLYKHFYCYLTLQISGGAAEV